MKGDKGYDIYIPCFSYAFSPSHDMYLRNYTTALAAWCDMHVQLAVLHMRKLLPSRKPCLFDSLRLFYILRIVRNYGYGQ